MKQLIILLVAVALLSGCVATRPTVTVHRESYDSLVMKGRVKTLFTTTYMQKKTDGVWSDPAQDDNSFYYEFDRASRILLCVNRKENGTIYRIITNEYDEYGNLLKMRELYGDSTVHSGVDYLYDSIGKRTGSISYNERGKVYGEGSLVTHTRDSLERVIKSDFGSYYYLYGWDDAGHQILKEEYEYSKQKRRETWEYDKLGRLVSRTEESFDKPYIGNEYHYTYDKKGNVISRLEYNKHNGKLYGWEHRYTYNKQGDRLTSTHYDLQGNLLDKRYNDDPAPVTTYRYDSHGNKTEKRVVKPDKIMRTIYEITYY